MIRINLLPYVKAKKRENVIQQVSVFLLIVLIVAVALIWYNSKLNKEIESLLAQIDYTKKEVVRYKKIAEEVEELKQKLALLKKKLEIIEQLDADRETAYTVVSYMSEVVIDRRKKKRLWFTKLSAIEQKAKKAAPPAKGKKGKSAEPAPQEVEVEKTNVAISIEGIALDDKTVADFMTRLGESGLFTDVKLITLRQQGMKTGGKEEINLKGFQIDCNKPPVKKPDTATAAGDKEEKTATATDAKEEKK
ncbi:MAG: PilN domain-containing protein [Desulfococcaceae bacterium]